MTDAAEAMPDCAELERTHALADGELAAADAQAARDHVATCAVCQAELAELMQLAALPRPAARAEVPGPREAPIIPLATWRRRRVLFSSVALAVAAAAGVALYVAARRGVPAPDARRAPQVALAAVRPVEARFAWSGAADYRAYSVARAGDRPHEAIPLAALAELERTGDLHGVGVLALLDGDLAQATSYLERSGDSPDVLADRAALALSAGDPTRALGLADAALAVAPTHPVALWNRALALRDLGLEHGAAVAFRAVATRGEPGWAAEATMRATALEAGFGAQLDLSLRVAAAAGPLAATQTGLTLEDARALPGLARIDLYDAIRSAPTADALAKLLPLAQAIDEADRTVSAAAMIARTHNDAKLAAGYAAILADKPPARAAYLAQLRAAHAADLLIGALVLLAPDGRTVPVEDLPELEKLTAASPDPWFQLLGIEQLGRAALARHDLVAAEQILLRARPLCDAGAPSFRCMKTAQLLGETYLAWERLPEAKVALFDAWTRARMLQQWEQQSYLLPDLRELAVIADTTIGGGLSLARAYSDEVRARADVEQQRHLGDDACAADTLGRERVATILFNQLRFTDAAAELAAAPACDLVTYDLVARTARIFIRAEVAHVSGTPEQVTQLRTEIAALRGTSELGIGEQAMLDVSEGRLLSESDPGAAEALLRHAISLAKTAPATETNAHRAVGFGYALLATSAATRGDGAAALAVLADELGVTAPATCALGLAVEDATMVAVGRGPGGTVVLDHHTRTSVVVDPTAIVSREVVAALRGCAVVDVLARPPLHGASRILPDDIAWRYVSARSRPVGVAATARVVVADVVPPPTLGLPRLSSWPAPGAEQIAGATATPARVLAAIGSAGEVIVHAHGLADRDDASYLALSPDAAGRYALTAGDVRAATFTSSPLVILAACSAARAAPMFHERWSLPAAFIFAGARAVVASTAAIPDDAAGAFFEELRTAAATGTPIAVALRDVRAHWLTRAHSDWVRDIIVFE